MSTMTTNKFHLWINHLKSKYTGKYSQSSPQAKYNPWIIGWFGLVAVFLCVNALFIVLANTSNPGLVVDNYYEQGRQYEKNAIKLLDAQNRLQWLSKLDVPEQIIQGIPGNYRFNIVDARGLPLKDANVKLVAYRPSNANADFNANFQSVAPGNYQTSLSFPLPGIWDLNISVQRGEDRIETVQRVSVKN